MLCVALVLVLCASVQQGGAQSTPEVSITNPTENEIVGVDVHVEGTASPGAKGVEIKIDASDIWNQATLGGNGTWYRIWNTTGVSKDYHTIYARSYNGTVKSEVKSVRVFVDNDPPERIDLEVTLTPEESRPNRNLTVSGFAEYGNSVKVAGASVDIEIVEQGTSAQTVTGSDGYFSVKLQAPANAGDYTLRTIVSDGKLTGQDDSILRVRDPDQPDLVVTQIVLDPEEPRDGDEITFTAWIDNRGVQEATTRVKFYINGDLAGSQDITVVESKKASIEWDSYTGNHTVMVEASEVVPQDKDLANNELSVNFYVKSMSRLELEEVVFSNPVPVDGDLITISVRAKNKGDIAARGTLVLYKGKPSDNIKIAERQIVVAANETEFFYFNWKAMEGDYKVYAKIYLTTEDESIYHEAHREISVGEAPPEPRESPSVGILGLVGVIVVAALVKFFAAGRRD
jgi:hypothetical protein